ncbi:hypothetical protein D7B24_003603 [Verticillium nonalfalfae]|uniref:ORC6 first cyclin-like domain-containing protein n=1 Tax=Verticillium nonalfalfae TaxID=1051616 RepID=A0A3M9YG59_9PEZI|nr:uncharacterized protein D7B24_003603 [Verticillium nonalfalfae]RNJ59051.1 hypothetical protein D7B24_003603 [Verticillium nonalfalfae]
MSRSIEQALLQLMPTHATDLPPPLVELASALLAQSRHRASTLKAEEEVARLHACCHIACDRLKITLDLPPIHSRPPIPPRIYQRLYAHLDNILPHNVTARTPAKNRHATPRPRHAHADTTTTTTASGRPLPSRTTPSKETTLAPFRAAAAATPTKSTGRAVPPVDTAALHPWIRPTIRFLCRASGHPRLAPTLLAGMERAVAPGGRRTRDPWVLANLTGLVAAFYFFVVQQLRVLRTGEPITEANYLPVRAEVLALLTRARQELVVGGGRGLDEDDDAWAGWQALRRRDFIAVTDEVTRRAFLQEDWYVGIRDLYASGAFDEAQADDADTHEAGGEEDAARLTKMTIRRADTMFQDRYEYLSEGRRLDYRLWKEGVLQRIERAEGTAQDGMDVD